MNSVQPVVFKPEGKPPSIGSIWRLPVLLLAGFLILSVVTHQHPAMAFVIEAGVLILYSRIKHDVQLVIFEDEQRLQYEYLNILGKEKILLLDLTEIQCNLRKEKTYASEYRWWLTISDCRSKITLSESAYSKVKLQQVQAIICTPDS